uniref:Uncharacterized protein n=1 Tax=uncultured prokaryote TaxID=198431 RepID=A0A0H5Q4R9_9ZZZZ|nr:hypothetical protein [uncultured prokaryote]
MDSYHGAREETGSLARFDWYAATLPEQTKTAGIDVLAALGDARPELVRGQYGYPRGWKVQREGSTLLTVFEGDDLRDHVVATGADAHEVAGAMKRRFPAHSVSRADVCLDFDAGPSFFAETRALAHELLAGKVTLTDYVETAPKGIAATLYVGSRASEVRARLYEKGKESPDTHPPDRVRLEVQVRPQKPDRKALASMVEPIGFWGFSRWSRELLEEVSGRTAPAAPVRSARVSDLDGALDAMAKQYGRRLLQLAERLEGDYEAIAVDLLRRVAQQYPNGES